MFSPFRAPQLSASYATYLFIQQDPSAGSPVTRANSCCFSCSCKEKARFWPHKTRTVHLSESSQQHFEPNFTFYHQRKNSSKYEVHTCCINIYICAYIHTHAHGAAMQNLQRGFGPRFVSSETHLVECTVLKTSIGEKPTLCSVHLRR